MGRRRIVERVVASECLYEAFASLRQGPKWTPNSNHGTFGQINEWADYRDEIAAWLSTAGQVDAIVDRLTAHTPLPRHEIETLRDSIRQQLVPQVDWVVEKEKESTDTELSAVLARYGVVPMFGFPTRVRTLWGRSITSRSGMQDYAISDRSLELAVRSFAPAAEVVKDGLVHTVAGFAAYKPMGNTVRAVDPLGTPRIVGRCGHCERMELSSDLICSVCGNPEQRVDLYEPRGFRTNYQPRAFDDDQEVLSSVSPPSLVPAGAPTSTDEAMNLRLELYSQSQLVSINDNFGRGYVFRPQGDNTVLADTAPSGASPMKTIGEVRVTDALLITPTRLEVGTGSVALYDIPSGRAAYTSFAEVLRRAAQACLDLDPVEITAGVLPLRLPICLEDGSQQGTQVGGAVFLADTAENGAGYAVELGRTELFATMLKSALDELSSVWEQKEHAENCDTSCPDCLRSYNNAQRHALLDWRLALDVLELVIGEPFTASRSLPTCGEWMDAAAAALNGSSKIEFDGVPAIARRDKCVVLCHPLWRQEEQFFSKLQRSAVEAARGQYAHVVTHDLREFRRNPISIWRYLQ